MKVISQLKNIAKKSKTLRILMRKMLYFSKKIMYLKRGIGTEIHSKMVVFSAYNGRSYVCSPKAVYEYMQKLERFSNYQFIWLFDHPEKYQFLTQNRNTIVVKNGSAACERYLHQAKYWIFNFRAYDQWIPKKEQVYVQCWHGTPLKRLGYDITDSDNAMNSVEEIREKYRTDAKRFSYLLSSCNYVTEKFCSAWNLINAGKQDSVLEIGYPRNDYLVSFSKENNDAIKRKLHLDGCEKKIILYAPTWRDNQHDAERGYIYDNPVDFDYLREQLEKEYIILFRAHYLVAENFDFRQYEGFLYDVSSYDDINELYMISDLLVTDYSSVFFDYAILERPILFYMYDMEEYRDEMRGFYLNVEELPGAIVKTELELVDEIKKIDLAYTVQQMKTFNETYNMMNDGNAAERLINKVFPNEIR